MDPSQNPNVFHATTIVCVRRGEHVAIAGDGQVTLGHTVMKGNARKVRRRDGQCWPVSPVPPPMPSPCSSCSKPSWKSTASCSAPRSSWQGLAHRAPPGQAGSPAGSG